jgi:hypothetical protein
MGVIDNEEALAQWVAVAPWGEKDNYAKKNTFSNELLYN